MYITYYLGCKCKKKGNNKYIAIGAYLFKLDVQASQLSISNLSFN